MLKKDDKKLRDAPGSTQQLCGRDENRPFSGVAAFLAVLNMNFLQSVISPVENLPMYYR